VTRGRIWGGVAALAVAAGLAMTSAPAGACACGVAIDARVTEETALVIERPGNEEIILSLDLASESDARAAVVLPVPGMPVVSAIEGDDPLAYLETATAPPVVGSSAGGGDDGATAAPPVEVIGREEIGGYDVARLEAGDAAALDRWLTENDYELPPGAEPILDEYVEEGWRFVAIRLASEAEGRLKPLAVSFPTSETVYPMRLDQLADGPINITLFTLADGPRTTEWLSETWSGPVDELSPAPPADLAELFAQGTHITRLEAAGLDPAAFTDDLTIEPVAEVATDPLETDSSGAATAAPPATEPDDDGISTGVVIALIVAGLAFAVALAVATRP
jgi:hypothetical protein